MSDDAQNLDPSWQKFSRFHPPQEDTDTLLNLLKHADWSVRWNAARSLYFQPDGTALEALMDLLKNDSHDVVRLMAAQALGALHEMGVEVPMYAHLADKSAEARKNLAIKRLKELKVKVIWEKDHYRLMIPHKPLAPVFLEIGYLMGQLIDVPFPEHFAPFTDVPSLVLPDVKSETIDFAESYPSALKFRIYPHGRGVKG